MPTIEKALSTLASALRIDAAELTAALKDGDDWLSEGDFAEKLKGVILTEVKAARQESRDRALRENSDAVKKQLKAAGFQPESDQTGKEALEAFIESAKAQSVDGESVKTISRDELAQLPEVKKLLQEARAKVLETRSTEFDALKSEYETYKTRTEAKMIQDATLRFVTGSLEKGNVLLEPSGAKVSKEARIKAVLAQLDMGKIRLNDAGHPFLIDETGAQATDPELGKPIDLEKLIVGIGRDLYGERGADPGLQGANPRTGSAAPATGVPAYRFADEKAYTEAKNNEPDPVKRAAMSAAYLQQMQSAAG
jgi:hypothetical protein